MYIYHQNSKTKHKNMVNFRMCNNIFYIFITLRDVNIIFFLNKKKEKKNVWKIEFYF